MKNVKTIQVSYARGMNENVRQSLNFDSGSPLTSVLWLENFNPNFEHETLTKRFGLRQLFTTENIKNFAKNIIDYESERAKDEIVVHSAILGMSNPKSMNVHLFFVRRLPSLNKPDFMPEEHELIRLQESFEVEATGLIARVREHNGYDWVTLFTEPYSENERGILPKTDYPGWYVLGTLQDSVKYGESILYVTALKGLPGKSENFKEYFDLDSRRKEFTKFMYPVYYWKRWDVTKLREDGTDRFWNGLVIGGEDGDGRLVNQSLFSRCKTSKPGMSLIREKQFKIGYIDGDIIKEVGTDEELTSLNSKVNLVIWEGNILDNPYFYDTTALDKKDVTNKEQYPIWEYEFTPEHYTEYRDSWVDGYTEECIRAYSYVFSTELLDLEDINIKFIDDYRVNWKCPFSIDLMDSAGDGPVPFALNYPDGKMTRFYWKTRNREFRLLVYGEEVSSVETSGGQMWWNRLYKAMTFGLPDYLNLGIPRHYFKGEKIPFIITATINGIEVVVADSVYEVRTETTWSKPQMFNTKDQHTEETMDWAVAQGNDTGIPNGTSDTDGKLKYDYIGGKAFGSPPDPLYFATLKERYNMVYFTIRLQKDYLIEADVSSINIYIAQPDSAKDKSLFRSQGVFGFSDPPVVAYRKPVMQSNKDKDYSQYRLVKRFLIKGKGKKQDNWDYKYYNQHEQSETETNAWMGDPSTDWIWAVPQKGGDEYPAAKSLLGQFAPIDWMPDKVNKRHKEEFWTPDFIVWDYPTNKIPLVLQSSGEYYEGLGAKLVQVIKGRTFIANCIDKNGELEQSIIRYSAVQGGAISPDVFNKEDKLRVGHLEFTALVEYREQLICFNRQANYRIIMPNVAVEDTWEFLDAQLGQGTFNQKTVITTPYGMCYGNESGVWISDGRKGLNLVDNAQAGVSLLSLWQKLAMNNPYIFNSLISPGEVYINEDGYNPYLEFIYDEKADELNIITPVARNTGEVEPWAVLTEDDYYLNLDYELRMIYSFASKNWRIETYKLHKGGNEWLPAPEYVVKTYSGIHNLHYTRDNLYTSRLYYVPGDNNNIHYEIAISDNDYLVDVYLSKDQSKPDKEKILSELITHEIGDGKNDFLFDKVNIELVPRDSLLQDSNRIIEGWNTYEYSLRDKGKTILENIGLGTDPMLLVELRNKQFSKQKFITKDNIENNWSLDLVEVNYLAKIGVLNNISEFGNKKGDKINPFLVNITTPAGINSEESYSDGDSETTATGRSSLIMTAPHHSKFRSARIMFASEIIAKLKTIDIHTVLLTRRTQ